MRLIMNEYALIREMRLITINTITWIYGDTEHAHWVQYFLVIKGPGHKGGHTE